MDQQKLWRVTSYLGEEITSKSHLLSTEPNAEDWLNEYILDTKTSRHPARKMVIETFVLESTQEIVPTDPADLADIVGPTDEDG